MRTFQDIRGQVGQHPEGAVELDAATKPEVGQTVVVYHGGHVDKDVTEPNTWFGLDPTVSAVRIGEMGEDRTIHRAVITITKDTEIFRGRSGTDLSWHIMAGKGDVVIPLAAKSEATSVMNFRQWLEIVGFHGSSEDFDEFDPKMIGQAKKTSISKLGFFFAPNREEANIYADLAQGGDGFIGKWEIDIQNPYNMSYEEFNDLIDWGSLDQQKHKSHQEAEAATIAKRKELEEQGYDGIYIRNYAGTKIAEIVIFSPHQAKKVDVEPGINVWV